MVWMAAKELATKVVHAHLVPEYSKINLGPFIWTCETELSSSIWHTFILFHFPFLLIFFLFFFFFLFFLFFYGGRGVENTICYFTSSLVIFVYIHTTFMWCKTNVHLWWDWLIEVMCIYLDVVRWVDATVPECCIHFLCSFVGHLLEQ